MKRKELKQKRYELNSFISRHEDLEKELSVYLGDDYREYHLKLQNALKKLDDDIQALPTGHRYSGTYYIRKPYTAPIEAEKIDGSAFMREDLVTWKPEEEGKKPWELAHKKSIYRDPELRIPIEREEGQPVFDEGRYR